ncbi:ferredoxin [Actinoalloteichus hymeniacidonis]|uniref:Ferredoxin n=1 Tax=Actinoalloteichus hymeniacidonis TaxID=340345 RepID=A0AAC9HPQ2_9PSEU|nr:ferredoxin [Actinoalloteichus hymeniacidonis]AOS63123.1 ferredoxin [Actinoalloteichus hymeniacidonis]MBB5908841.1 ferredoxin [Actinoalloteichus hymeniacidonis]
MRVEVDRQRCVGAGMCALTAPEMFDQDEHDGRVVLLVADPAASAHDEVREAAELCPAEAIRLRSD